MRVYLIRHGESENNRKGLWTGWIDASLTEQGKEDAKNAGRLLAPLSFDKIYASDLIRAQETARIAIPGCRYEKSPLLREVDLGALGGQPLGAVTEQQRAIIASSGYQIFGGESTEAFQSRIHAFMKVLEGLECENVAVFSHGGWLRGFFNTVVGIPLPRKHILCRNCTVAIFEYAKETWSLHSWINPQ